MNIFQIYIQNEAYIPRTTTHLKCIRFGRLATIIFTVCAFVPFSALASISASKAGNDGIPFGQDNGTIAVKIVGYLFLALFLLMATLTTVFVVQIRSENKRIFGNDRLYMKFKKE